MRDKEDKVVDLTQTVVSTHNVVPNRRRATAEDIGKFLERRDRILTAYEEKESKKEAPKKEVKK